MTMYFTIPTGDVLELEYCEEAERLRAAYPTGFLQAVDPRTQYILKYDGSVIGIFDNEFIAYKYLKKVQSDTLEWALSFGGFAVEPRDLLRLPLEEKEYLEHLSHNAQRRA